MSIHNHFQAMGRLLADPELKTLPSGDMVLNGAFMMHEPYRNPKTGETGERQQKFQFEQWGAAAENTANLVGVGDQIQVAGRLRVEEWVDRNGLPRYTLRVKADRVSLVRQRAVKEYTPEVAPVRNPDEVYADATI